MLIHVPPALHVSCFLPVLKLASVLKLYMSIYAGMRRVKYVDSYVMIPMPHPLCIVSNAFAQYTKLVVSLSIHSAAQKVA